MRLWHQKLIPHLDRQRLLGQHRECCALRGKGWGKKHSVVNYVFNHEPSVLIAYHYLIMEEMRRRGYNPDVVWMTPDYRGKILGIEKNWAPIEFVEDQYIYATRKNGMLYDEHNDEYMNECLKNLKEKGVEIQW